MNLERLEIDSTNLNLEADHFQRVNVVGLSGSGKSTFARLFSDILQSDYIEMDRLFHGPDWTEPDESEFRNRISIAISGERWVLDGNYHSKTHDLKWNRATLIIWINTPFARNVWQSTSRSLKRAWTKEELWPGTGNHETFRRNLFSTQSMILWVLCNYHRIQHRYKEIREDPKWSHIPFIEIRGKRDAEDLINLAEGLIGNGTTLVTP